MCQALAADNSILNVDSNELFIATKLTEYNISRRGIISQVQGFILRIRVHLHRPPCYSATLA